MTGSTNERKENAKKEVSRKRREALAHVNRQHSSSKRQVLLAGISDEVMSALDTIPSAASVFESMPTQLT